MEKQVVTACRGMKQANTGTGARKQQAAKVSATKTKQKKMRYDQQILHHMVMSMKPFSARVLAQELNTTEQQLHHALLGMKDKGLVIEKEFTTSSNGRCKTLMWANLESHSKDAIPATYDPEKACEARRQLLLLQKQEAGLQQELSVLTELPCNNDLSAQLDAAETELASLKQLWEKTRARIKRSKVQAPAAALSPGFRGVQPQLVPKSAAQLSRERCPRGLKIRINIMRQEWRNRKEKCKDFIENLSDAMEKKPKQVNNILDVETDESVGVIMPKKYQIT